MQVWLGADAAVPRPPEQLPTGDAVARLYRDRPLHHVREQRVLAVAVIDHHVIPVELQGIRDAWHVVARPVFRDRHLPFGRRDDRPPPAEVLLVARAIALERALRLPDQQVEREPLVRHRRVPVVVPRATAPQHAPGPLERQPQRRLRRGVLMRARRLGDRRPRGCRDELPVRIPRPLQLDATREQAEDRQAGVDGERSAFLHLLRADAQLDAEVVLHFARVAGEPFEAAELPLQRRARLRPDRLELAVEEQPGEAAAGLERGGGRLHRLELAGLRLPGRERRAQGENQRGEPHGVTRTE